MQQSSVIPLIQAHIQKDIVLQTTMSRYFPWLGPKHSIQWRHKSISHLNRIRLNVEETTKHDPTNIFLFINTWKRCKGRL